MVAKQSQVKECLCYHGVDRDECLQPQCNGCPHGQHKNRCMEPTCVKARSGVFKQMQFGDAAISSKKCTYINTPKKSTGVSGSIKSIPPPRRSSPEQKTVCRNYRYGKCRFGNDCRYEHTPEDKTLGEKAKAALQNVRDVRNLDRDASSNDRRRPEPSARAPSPRRQAVATRVRSPARQQPVERKRSPIQRREPVRARSRSPRQRDPPRHKSRSPVRNRDGEHTRRSKERRRSRSVRRTSPRKPLAPLVKNLERSSVARPRTPPRPRQRTTPRSSVPQSSNVDFPELLQPYDRSYTYATGELVWRKGEKYEVVKGDYYSYPPTYEIKRLCDGLLVNADPVDMRAVEKRKAKEGERTRTPPTSSVPRLLPEVVRHPSFASTIDTTRSPTRNVKRQKRSRAITPQKLYFEKPKEPRKSIPAPKLKGIPPPTPSLQVKQARPPTTARRDVDRKDIDRRNIIKRTPVSTRPVSTRRDMRSSPPSSVRPRKTSTGNVRDRSDSKSNVARRRSTSKDNSTRDSDRKAKEPVSSLPTSDRAKKTAEYKQMMADRKVKEPVSSLPTSDRAKKTAEYKQMMADRKRARESDLKRSRQGDVQVDDRKVDPVKEVEDSSSSTADVDTKDPEQESSNADAETKEKARERSNSPPGLNDPRPPSRSSSPGLNDNDKVVPRASSEPPPGRSDSKKRSDSKSSRKDSVVERPTEFKKPERRYERCRDFENGKCSKGDVCRFTHDTEFQKQIIDLDSKQSDSKRTDNPVQRCIDFANGKCNRGDRCRYSHDDFDITQFKKGLTSIPAPERRGRVESSASSNSKRPAVDRKVAESKPKKVFDKPFIPELSKCQIRARYKNDDRDDRRNYTHSSPMGTQDPNSATGKFWFPDCFDLESHIAQQYLNTKPLALTEQVTQYYPFFLHVRASSSSDEESPNVFCQTFYDYCMEKLTVLWPDVCRTRNGCRLVVLESGNSKKNATYQIIFPDICVDREYHGRGRQFLVDCLNFDVDHKNDYVCKITGQLLRCHEKNTWANVLNFTAVRDQNFRMLFTDTMKKDSNGDVLDEYAGNILKPKFMHVYMQGNDDKHPTSSRKVNFNEESDASTLMQWVKLTRVRVPDWTFHHKPSESGSHFKHDHNHRKQLSETNKSWIYNTDGWRNSTIGDESKEFCGRNNINDDELAPITHLDDVRKHNLSVLLQKVVHDETVPLTPEPNECKTMKQKLILYECYCKMKDAERIKCFQKHPTERYKHVEDNTVPQRMADPYLDLETETRLKQLPQEQQAMPVAREVLPEFKPTSVENVPVPIAPSYTMRPSTPTVSNHHDQLAHSVQPPPTAPHSAAYQAMPLLAVDPNQHIMTEAVQPEAEKNKKRKKLEIKRVGMKIKKLTTELTFLDSQELSEEEKEQKRKCLQAQIADENLEKELLVEEYKLEYDEILTPQ